MRIFSILAALAVVFLLFMAIFERPSLVAFFSGDPASETAAPSDLSNGENDLARSAPIDTKALVKVVVQRSTSQRVDSAVILRGQTAAARQVDVRSEISAIVASAPLRKGARISEGQALCVLDSGARLSALAEMRARLSEADSRVPEAEARVEEAQSRLKEAKINENAAARLSADGFATQTRVAATEAAVAAANAGITSATAGLRAARSGIESATAAIATVEKDIERLTILAPFAGLLESDTAELGSLLQPGSLCATIIQLDPIKLIGFVPETEVNRVELGALAGARLAAGGKEVTGNVTFISRSSDPATRTFMVEIDVPNTDLAIRDGQTAEIAISSQGLTAHLLPQSALTLNDEGTLGLRLVDDANLVSFNPVTLIRDTAKGVWVSGLPDTANVIVLGQEYVTSGVTVAPTYQELSQ